MKGKKHNALFKEQRIPIGDLILFRSLSNLINEQTLGKAMLASYAKRFLRRNLKYLPNS